MASVSFDSMTSGWDSLGADEALAWALSYVDRGWHVWPTRGPLPSGRCTCRADCKGAGKHGRPGWTADLGRMEADFPRRLHKNAVQRYWSPDNVDDEPTDNVAVLPHLSGLVVVDVDGRDMWDTWMGRVDLPDTLTDISPRREGGWHLFYEWDGGYAIRGTVPGTKLELKRNSLVLMTPSLHKSGGRYRWVDYEVPVARAPDWLVEPSSGRDVIVDGHRITDAEATEIRTRARISDLSNKWVASLFAADISGVAALHGLRTKDGRPRRLYACAYYLAEWALSGLLSDDQIREMLLEAAEVNGAVRDYGREDIERQINNGLTKGRWNAMRRIRDGI